RVRVTVRPDALLPGPSSALAPSPGGAPVPSRRSSDLQNMTPTFQGTAGQRVFVWFTNDTVAGGKCCNLQATLVRPDGSWMSNLKWVEDGTTHLALTTLPLPLTHPLLTHPLRPPPRPPP